MSRYFLLLAPALLRAAEEAGAAHAENITYKWINFGILAAGIAFLVVKFILPILKARSEAIGKDLADSKATVQAADAKVRELTAKLTHFDQEIGEIRDRALAEREVEAKRIQAQTQSLLAKLSENGATEIGNATQVAIAELRAFTARKAIEIAEARFKNESNPETQGALVQAFVSDLKAKEAR
ncbi:hypothetical protein [Bryobacter aggregatus]|uniref:F0F1 ATP synthase subunit B family protein n=1 Tax=Bryobacter aggregatus TaxID=360054 RepID=UPI0004E21EAB|nr:hypothetical protein [Bryobacter aggregatus]